MYINQAFFFVIEGSAFGRCDVLGEVFSLSPCYEFHEAILIIFTVAGQSSQGSRGRTTLF